MKANKRNKKRGRNAAYRPRPTNRQIPRSLGAGTGRNGTAINVHPSDPGTRIPRLIDPRYVDTSISQNIVSIWTNTDLTPIVQGIGDTNRTGRYTYLNELELQGRIVTQNADVFTAVRLVVVQWHPQSNVTPFNASNVFQVPNVVESFYNVDASENYTILLDVRYAMSGTASVPTASGYQTFYQKVSLRRAKKRQLYAAGTASSFDKLFFLTLSDSAIAPFPIMTGTARVRFST